MSPGNFLFLLKMQTFSTNGQILQMVQWDQGLNFKGAQGSFNSISNSKSNYTSHFVWGRKHLITAWSGTGCQKSEPWASACSSAQRPAHSAPGTGRLCPPQRLRPSPPPAALSKRKPDPKPQSHGLRVGGTNPSPTTRALCRTWERTGRDQLHPRPPCLHSFRGRGTPKSEAPL